MGRAGLVQGRITRAAGSGSRKPSCRAQAADVDRGRAPAGRIEGRPRRRNRSVQTPHPGPCIQQKPDL